MDRELPDYYVERTEESLPDTIQVNNYIKSLPPSKGVFRCPDPDPCKSHPSTSLAGEPYVYPVVIPRFAISTSDKLFNEIRDLVDSDPSLTIETHISENLAEVEWNKQVFAHLSKPGKPITYAGVYDHYHVLRHNTILAHAIYLEEEELQLVKERKCGISHCPTSNFNLTSGVAKVGDMLDRGIKVNVTRLVKAYPSLTLISPQVGLGTDVSGGFSPSMIRAVQNASVAAKVVALQTPSVNPDPNSFASKPLKVPTLFWLATLGGAEVCNLEHKIGSLQVGKAFDAIVVNVRNTSGSPHNHTPPYNPNLWGVGDDEDVGIDVTRGRDVEMDEEKKLKKELEAMLERLLFCGDDRNLRRVYVQGRWIGGTERPAGL